jgi:DNA (cytosine-5)-methyltransferase 1
MAADGYHAAGFDIIGVDINPQPHYPYPFLQGDALEVLQGSVPDVPAVIHVSPPCQAHTRARHLREAQGRESRYTDLLSPTLDLLREHWPHKIWVAENVPGAPGMEGAAVCCGSSFGLKVRRHRLFLSNVPLEGAVCRHKEQGRPVGVYYRTGEVIPNGGRTAKTVEEGREAMGVERPVPWNSLKEGFPPAYTHHIGTQLLAHLGNSRLVSTAKEQQ